MRKKLIQLALLAGAVTVVGKVLAAKKSEWQGLSESEVRQKLDSRIPSRVPEEKRAAVADNVVAKMRDRGILGEEVQPASATPEEEVADDEPPADDGGSEEDPPSQNDS